MGSGSSSPVHQQRQQPPAVEARTIRNNSERQGEEVPSNNLKYFNTISPCSGGGRSQRGGSLLIPVLGPSDSPPASSTPPTFSTIVGPLHQHHDQSPQHQPDATLFPSIATPTGNPNQKRPRLFSTGSSQRSNSFSTATAGRPSGVNASFTSEVVLLPSIYTNSAKRTQSENDLKNGTTAHVHHTALFSTSSSPQTSHYGEGVAHSSANSDGGFVVIGNSVLMAH